jgi:hypothetical protein
MPLKLIARQSLGVVLTAICGITADGLPLCSK